MSIPGKSLQDLYNLFVQNVLNQPTKLTDTNPGSELDMLAGTAALAGQEMQRLITIAFNKTFIQLANGPEDTGGPDDLQTVAVDKYGEKFARPGAVAAIDTVTFSRPTNAAGLIDIPKDTVVQTKPDANGNVQQYTTDNDIQLTANSSGTDLTNTVNITAIVKGAAGDAGPGAINVISSSLLDTTIVVTNVGNATGEDALDDADYRLFIYNLIQALAGATAQSVEAQALTVSGVISATPVENSQVVIGWNIATNSIVGSYFRIVQPILYIADDTGTASPALIDAVQASVDLVKALGVNIQVVAASAVTVSWTASVTLNPLGPNYATFQDSLAQIVATMKQYIIGLPTGTGFSRAIANAAMLAIWGPSGTNDITAFTTSIPSGDVSAAANQKVVPGTVTTI